MFRVIILVLTLSFSVSACVTMTDKAAGVQVYSQESKLLDGCVKLGAIWASASVLAIPVPDPVTVAEIRLREAAADKGGNSVVILSVDRFVTEVKVQGVALRCR